MKVDHVLGQSYYMREEVKKVVQHIKEARSKEFEWLFLFAGWLKGRLDPGEELDDNLREHWLEFFAEAVNRELSPSRDWLDWKDPEAVDLAFDKAWTQRKFAFDSEYLNKAMDEAYENPLGLSVCMNSWVSRVINLAYCLQKHNPDLPFIIPVSDSIANQFGTSIRTLSQALEKAIELGYVQVVEEAKMSRGLRRARRLRFNYEKLEAARRSSS